MRFCLEKISVCKAVSMAKIDFDHTKAIDTEAPYPLFVCVCVCFFFLLVKNFGRLDTPLTKIPGSAPVRNLSLATKIWFYRKYSVHFISKLCAELKKS